MTNFNERTNTLLYKNIPLTLYSRKCDVACVWEVSWRRRQTAILTPSSSSAIAALLSHLGWVAQQWVTEGLATLSLQASSHAGILSPTDSNRPAPGYIIFWRSPASAVLPLIYTGPSLDWLLGRGSIYNTTGNYLIKEMPSLVILQWRRCIFDK